MKQIGIQLARRLTEPFLLRKSLPADFGHQRVYVSSRSDIRLLAPGLERSGGDLFEVVRRYVNAGDVVWDIGSNLGLLTFAAAVKVGQNGRVYSLEADPRYADIQTRTLKSFSNEAGQVSVLCGAVASSESILDLVVPKNGHARNHLGVVEGNAAATAEMTKQVLTLRLDWLLNHWAKPQFVKIDVEGAERLAVEGGDQLFRNVRPIAYIECAPENVESLTSFFVDRNYDLFALDEHDQERRVSSFQFNTLVKPRDGRSTDAL